jgi:hypothetical protein
MRFKDILPNTIYRVTSQHGTRGYIRTGDTVSAVPTYGEPREGKRNTHLLLTIDRGYHWSEDNPELDRYVDLVEVLRWVDNAEDCRVVHGEEALDLTFQPAPFVTTIGDITRSYNWDLSDLPVDSLPADIAQQVVAYNAATEVWEAAHKAEEKRTEYDVADEWYEANPEPESPEYQLAEALEAEWGTKYFRYVETRSGSPVRSTVKWGERVNLSKVDGPYTEADLAAARLAEKAQRAEAEARYAERSAAREALRTEARSFLVTTLANVPDALVENTSNGLPRDVEAAQKFGRSDWSLDGGYRDDIDTETPDGKSLVGLQASTLAAISYAWQQTFGDASWEDISAGVYERFHEADEVKHIGVRVPATEDVEVTAERVARFLPANYKVVGTETYRNSSEVFVKGTDVAGWTADGYVIPRLATGLLVAEVYSVSRQAVTA